MVAQDPEMIVWWGSGIECASAIARLYREEQLTAKEERAARAFLNALSASWFEIQPGNSVRDQALRVLRLHPLRAADALQLAAALESSGSAPSGMFVTYDERLRALPPSVRVSRRREHCFVTDASSRLRVALAER